MNIIKGNVFQLNSKPNCLVEVVIVEDSHAKVLEYNERGSACIVVDISDLKKIPLSIPILNSLGFEGKEDRLM